MMLYVLMCAANCLIRLLVTTAMVIASGRISKIFSKALFVPQQLNLDREREREMSFTDLICWIQTSTGEAVANKMKIRIMSTLCRQIHS